MKENKETKKQRNKETKKETKKEKLNYRQLSDIQMLLKKNVSHGIAFIKEPVDEKTADSRQKPAQKASVLTGKKTSFIKEHLVP